MLGVVFFCCCFVGDAQVHGGELQALALNAGDDLADESAFNAIGLDQNQGTFSHVAQYIGRPQVCCVVSSPRFIRAMRFFRR